MSERTPSTPSNPPRPDGAGAASKDPSLDPPTLRLAGTTAGPVTDEERRLLELRAEIVLASGRHGVEAGLVRDRLGRAGRRDPMALVRGSDLFDRTAADLSDLLATIDARLAEIDAGRPSIEIDAKASDLLRRP